MASLKKRYGLIVILSILVIVTLYGIYRPLPEGVSYESDSYYVNNIDFLYDLTYQKDGLIQMEHEIFTAIEEAVSEAEEFIVFDMFLYNDFYDPELDFPPLSQHMTDVLIEKKQAEPDIEMLVLSDEINTTYGSHKSQHFEQLRDAGIDVVVVDVTQLRDSNPLYSGIWRTFIQWFGQSGSGWLPNAFSPEAPDVTLRSYLKLFNVKANHRKVVATEKTAIISSANPHDASAYHSNIAIQVDGPIIDELVYTENAASEFSDGPTIDVEARPAEEGEAEVRVITEGRIYERTLELIEEAESGDELWFAMFYLSDRDVINSLIDASNRGVQVRLVLDPNKDAFGQEKVGLPNRPVAAELLEEGQIEVRWYDTIGEQFHPKLMARITEDQTTVIGGSANFTSRNLRDYNLETNLWVKAPNEQEFSQDITSYFERVWNNEQGHYTVPYEEYEDNTTWLTRFLYRMQKITGLTTY
ncbi:putative cardiolipin synthase [Alkalihalophilus pseudofirmus OF4]|uniref:phospholipase D n=1 Tax=Alkalihalophilus pseudofirmus (strain ATCC BAA-2126 / JCM 17055 / OF4) TaxID=398511 RepID=D3FWH5_ALKPO|nr:phospholipase D family protein [Alkalihalophilus pseudofirmus]ADC48707.1 putative cardiolipin synthase [Alkalihalophilus pseudofirmus OF4]